MRWIIFHLCIFFVLAIDLIFFRKGVKWKGALAWSICWIFLSFLFNGYIFWQEGTTKGVEFFTAYLMEKSLSIDNLFVFLLIFSYFKIPKPLQHRLLFWGVVGAFILRLGMILAGVALVSLFSWLTYLLGLIVGFTGIKLIVQKQQQLTLEKSRLLKFMRASLPITEEFVQDKFAVWRRGKLYLTPLCLALVMLESSDILFAIDSIPTVLSVTNDIFIAYTSNVFAVLGLRDLFFVMEPWFDVLARLKVGLGAILLFIGLKLILAPFIAIPTTVSLAVVVMILALSVIYIKNRMPKA
jgi:tellurite resistance protein TerC